MPSCLRNRFATCVGRGASEIVSLPAHSYGLGFALAVSVASMLAFNFFHLPPVHTFTLADSSNWFALAVYLGTAVVVSELAARSLGVEAAPPEPGSG